MPPSRSYYCKKFDKRHAGRIVDYRQSQTTAGERSGKTGKLTEQRTSPYAINDVTATSKSLAFFTFRLFITRNKKKVHAAFARGYFSGEYIHIDPNTCRLCASPRPEFSTEMSVYERWEHLSSEKHDTVIMEMIERTCSAGDR